MQSLLTLLSLLFVVVSCSAGKGTKTAFKFEMSQQGLNSAGGLVIFGKEIGGNNGRFARIVSSQTITMDIPRGRWSIGGIAWDGVIGNMTGVIVCGITTVDLQGDEAQVLLQLLNSTCFTPAISIESGFGSDPFKTASGLDPSFCESDVGSLTGFCLYDKLNPGISPKRGFVGSFKLSIPGGASFDGVPSGEILESDCFDPDTKMNAPSQTTSLNTVNVPAFISGLGVPLHIDAYLGAACEASRGSIRLSFENSNVARFYENGTSFKKLYGKTPIAQICNVADSASSSDFASGIGSANYPHVICTASQLNHLSQAYTVALAAKSYILGRDIDLSSLSGAGSTPADDCLDPGDTFVPIVMNFTPGTCIFNNDSNPFTGSFDGNLFVIKNFRFKMSSAPVMGFIDELDGTVSNIKFEQASVEGNDSTGIAVGNMSSIGQISGVNVKNSDVRGSSGTGAIIGTTTSASALVKLSAQNVRVEGKSDVGGLVGYSSAPITDSSFNGSVTSNFGVSRIGGIVGNSASTIARSVSSGVLRGSAVMMGGIAGDATGCTFCRSDMLIIDQNTSGPFQRLIGGIIGNGSAVDSSLFLGDIQTNCGANAVCEIAGLIGKTGSTSTHNDSYSVQNIVGSGGVNGNITSFVVLSAGNSVFTGLCASHVGTCKWSYIASDIPRIVDVDDSHACHSTINNGAFASQGTQGTAANPHLICNTTQLLAISGTPDMHFSLEQSINLTPMTADTVGNFSGHFMGKNNVLFSHSINSPLSRGLFLSIGLTSSVRDLELAGFKYQSTSCPSCSISPLVQSNQGLVSRVRVTDFKLSTLSSDAKVGGIAAVNTGTISDSFVSGSIQGPANIGGVASLNQGTVTRNFSELKYTGSGSVTNIGGVVAVNRAVVTQNTFEGEINLSSVSAASKVGGIVGFLNHLTEPATVVDNHASSEAIIKVNGATSSTSAIVGFSDTSTDVVSRNVNSSFLFEPSNIPTVQAIVGSGTPDDVGDLNYAIASTYGVGALSTGASSTSFTDPFCYVSVLTATPFAGTSGAFNILNQIYFGALSGSVNTWTLAIPSTSSECAGSDFNAVSIGSINVYNSWTPPEMPSVTNLKDNNYDVVDMNDSDDRDRAIRTFLQIKEGKYPSDAPVWISEEEGLKLFNQVN